MGSRANPPQGVANVPAAPTHPIALLSRTLPTQIIGTIVALCLATQAMTNRFRMLGSALHAKRRRNHEDATCCLARQPKHMFWWSGKDAIRHRAEHICVDPRQKLPPPQKTPPEGGMGARPTTASPDAAISNKSADQGCTICEQHRRHPLHMCLTRQRPQYAHTEHNEALTRAAPRTRSRCFQQTPGTTPAPGQRTASVRPISSSFYWATARTTVRPLVPA